MTAEELINQQLGAYNVVVKFCKKASKDLSKYGKGQRNIIIALIINRGKKGPLLKPDGLGEPLGHKNNTNLSGFAKIKPKDLSLRIVYRPTKNGKILMGIIAIGPKDREKVYKIAAERLFEFNKEMSGS
ncbi:hypothetical protein [Bacillus sp. 03113]|uniref:hypothetical protein n=1 Tax=Bacillus sp. 03113 TaxID=2578211 RepID=UPI0011428DC9|nr:hypothetical protein [Bacillus sp. 03113]